MKRSEAYHILTELWDEASPRQREALRIAQSDIEFLDLMADFVTVNRWIPVKERLPDDLERVLTCDGKGNIHVMWHYHDYKYPFNIGKNDLRYFPVTHWMPLPSLPKEEKDG